MMIEAQTAIRWRYYIAGSELELYNNANLSRVPKAQKNILVCTRYLDYGLWLPFSPFVTMVLNHFRRAPSQYTTHFYLIPSIF